MITVKRIRIRIRRTKGIYLQKSFYSRAYPQHKLSINKQWGDAHIILTLEKWKSVIEKQIVMFKNFKGI